MAFVNGRLLHLKSKLVIAVQNDATYNVNGDGKKVCMWNQMGKYGGSGNGNDRGITG